MTYTFRKEYSQDLSKRDFADDIKYLAEKLEEHIDCIEGCREVSLALTKLEECVMWAVKAAYK